MRRRWLGDLLFGREPFELVDADDALGKHRADFQLSSHGGDAPPQRTEVHVGSVFELVNRGLIHVERFREFLLCQAQGVTQFFERAMSLG